MDSDERDVKKTRQKLKESYNAEFLATIERAEKQIILARHGMRLLKLLDDTPVVPGDVRPAYEGGTQARQILNDAEDDLRDWRPDVDEEASPQAEEKLPMQSTSRGSPEYSRDSGYAAAPAAAAPQIGGGDRASYDDKDAGFLPDTMQAMTATTSTAGDQESQRMSGASGVPVSQEELRGEQPLSSSPSPHPDTRPAAEAATAASSRRSGSRDLFGVVAEI